MAWSPGVMGQSRIWGAIGMTRVGIAVNMSKPSLISSECLRD